MIGVLMEKVGRGIRDAVNVSYVTEMSAETTSSLPLPVFWMTEKKINEGACDGKDGCYEYIDYDGNERWGHE